MHIDAFGLMPDGSPVERIRLGREPGVVVEVLTLGATARRVEVEGGDGVRRNVALGLGSVADYLASGDYLGGTIGRYANRIAGGRFELAGEEVVVGTHDRGNALHGGPEGFNVRVWEIVEADEDQVLLRLTSPHLDMGYPGNLTVTVRYAVEGSTVRVEHTASTDRTTVVNLTNHAYFNLDGDGAGSTDDHELQVHADAYTPVDETGIPYGGHTPVEGSPFDLRTPQRVGTVTRHLDPQIGLAQGIDHNYVLADAPGPVRPAARLVSRRTGTTLEVRTDQPGLQVYTGNFLDGRTLSPAGRRYRQGDGIALEPQLFPDSPNRPEWPSATLEPGDTYRSIIEWDFGTDA